MNRSTSIAFDRSTRLLFGAPSGWSARHPGTLLAAVILLALSADWIADTLAALIVGAP